MEVTTYNERFNILWNISNKYNHKNYEHRVIIGNFIKEMIKKDALVYIGDSPYGHPFTRIPVSYDGTNEYIIMNGEKILVYMDPINIYEEGKNNLSQARDIVWPATAVQWLLGGSDNQIEFVKTNSEKIGLNLNDINLNDIS